MRVCTVCQQPVPPGMPVCPRDGGAADDPSDDESLTGMMIGEYKLKGVIGEGGMGQVYEGLQPVIGKRVAIKLLRRELAADRNEAARLLSEARTVNAIGHRGIIDIFGFGALPDGRQYFVMEYLSGVSLSRHIRTHGALPVEDTLKLLDEILAALGAAHAAGVIHRDLKPSNIFLVSQPDGSSYVKLLDFGIAKQAPYSRGETPQTRVSRVMGTPEFMAPEQARGQAVGPRTDLYALGVVAFQMLTGELVFDADNPFELVNMHLSKEPPPPSSLRPEIPPEVDSLVLSLLKKSVADRPASAEAVREDIKRIRRTLNLSATRLMLAPTSMSASSMDPVPDAEVISVNEPRPEPRPLARDVETRAAVRRPSVPDTRILDEPESRPSLKETQVLDEPVEHHAPNRRAVVAVVAAALVLGLGIGGWLALRPAPEEGAAEVVGGLEKGATGGEGAEQTGPNVTGVAQLSAGERGADGSDAKRDATGSGPENRSGRAGGEQGANADVQELGAADRGGSAGAKDDATGSGAAKLGAAERGDSVGAKKGAERGASGTGGGASEKGASGDDGAKKKPRVDPLAARFRRAQTAWAKARTSRSAEDRRIFDMMIASVGKQLESGARADASEALNDFVAGALNGQEP